MKTIRNSKSIGVLSLVFAVIALSACSGSDGTSVDTSGSTPTSNESIVLLDPNTTLPSVIEPFREISVSPTALTDSLNAELMYVDTNSNKTIVQRIYRSNAEENFTALALPIDIDNKSSIEMYLRINGTEDFLGTVTIDSLPRLSQEFNPGEYSLHGMNAVLKEFISATDILKTRYETIVQSTHDTRQKQWLIALNEFSDNFQAIIGLCTDAVVFNSPIADPDSGQIVINQTGFALVDRIYLALSQRLINRGILFDGNPLASGDVSGPDLGESFSLFAHAIEDFAATENGVHALSSLSINVNSSDNAETLEAALNIFNATLKPSLATRLITKNTVGSIFPDTASTEKYNALMSTLEHTNPPETINNFIHGNTLDTLYWLNQVLQELQ